MKKHKQKIIGLIIVLVVVVGVVLVTQLGQAPTPSTTNADALSVGTTATQGGVNE